MSFFKNGRGSEDEKRRFFPSLFKLALYHLYSVVAHTGCFTRACLRQIKIESMHSQQIKCGGILDMIAGILFIMSEVQWQMRVLNSSCECFVMFA